MNTHRSSYNQTLLVLKEIADGLEPSEIKSKLFLSRYSYNYTVNRLLANDLVEYKDNILVLSCKGLNVLKFEAEYPGKVAENSRLQVVSSMYQFV